MNYLLLGITVILILFVLAYIFPFINSLWLKPCMLLWGYFVGGRKRRLLKWTIREKGGDEKSQASTMMEEIIKNEIKNDEDFHKEAMNQIESRLRSVEDEIDKNQKKTANRMLIIKKGYLGNKFNAIDRKISEIKFKNIVLLIALIAIVFVDAIIAGHVLKSLGLFIEDSIRIGGREIRGFPFIYGSFATIVIAIILHFTLNREKIKSWIGSHKIGNIIIFSIIIIIAILFLLSVVIPDLAKEFIEVIIRTCWIIGLFAIYWIGEEIVGDEKQYTQLLLPLILVLLVTGYVFFGASIIIGIIIEKIVEIASGSILRLRQVRINKIKLNEIARGNSIKRGFRRGFLG